MRQNSKPPKDRFELRLSPALLKALESYALRRKTTVADVLRALAAGVVGKPGLAEFRSPGRPKKA